MNINHWWLWGIGWLCMPRMTIGLILINIGLNDIGLPLAIIGGFFDLTSASSKLD